MELQFKHWEFEHEVRSELNVWDRVLTEQDAAIVTKLDLWNFDFQEEDYTTLCCFNNLKQLAIIIGNTTHDLWSHFPLLEDLCIESWSKKFDLAMLQGMVNLESLAISGGNRNIDCLNTDALCRLKNLHDLELFECGNVDVLPISQMKQLKSFGLRYAWGFTNIDAIGELSSLEELVLDGLEVDNLDFLDALPDSLRLTMCGITVRKDVAVHKWKRFAEHDIDEITIGEHYSPFAYIDLSELDAK